ncbi:hypothetical protein, partial [Rhodococcus sp. NPDC058514]|uniref:hypothetical protein n=1 Tax=Rhodococcus sp. NPDC058514 TaxID=3346532 RepID=UPI00365F5436
MRTRRVLALSAAGIATAMAVAVIAAGPATAGPAVSADPARVDTEREAVARAYIDALISHDASAVKFAPGATRVEAGLKTGRSGPQMTRDLEHGPQYRVLRGLRGRRQYQSGVGGATTHHK